MNEEPVTDEQEKAIDLIETLSVLALVRTVFSSERALLAWMRTSVSLYTFGFSITKFADYLERQTEGLQSVDGPRQLGLMLTSMGILVLVLGVVGHGTRMRRMKQLGLPSTSRWLLAVGAAAALFAIGIATSIGITLKWWT